MKISTIALVTSFLSLSACAATTPTPELVGARQAYDQARTDPNSKLVPDSVLSAKQALDKAEAVHNDSPQSDEDRSFSYVAQRRAELSARSRRERQSATGPSRFHRAVRSAAGHAAHLRGAKAGRGTRRSEPTRHAAGPEPGWPGGSKCARRARHGEAWRKSRRSKKKPAAW